MGVRNTDGNAVDVQAIRGVLAEIERAAALDAEQWADKRSCQRRRLNAPCSIRFTTPGSETVLSAEGQTRDISGGGLGFVSNQHFRRGAPLHITVGRGDGQARCLTGTVVYSRMVREGWYLTGVKFVRVDIEDMAVSAGGSQSTGRDGPADVTRLPTPASQSEEEQQRDGASERALRFLASTASAGVSSNAQINKIIVLTTSEDHAVRRATIPALMQITSSAGRLGLEGLLQDANPQIQVEAAEALGGIGAQTAIEPLKELLKHKKPDVALRVAGVLGRLGERSGIAVVRRYLAKDNPHTRDAVRTLGVIVGRKFRLNSDGIAEARRHLKKL